MSGHRSRRDEIAARFPDAIVLVRGDGPDGTNPNLFYLTGIDEPQAALLLCANGLRIGGGRDDTGPDYQRGRIVHSVLFLPRGDALAARWGEGARHTTDSVSAADAGVDVVLPTTRLETVLGRALSEGARELQVVRGFVPTLSGDDDPDTRFAHRLSRRYLSLDVGDATPAVASMRRLKDDAEVAAIERAAGITAEAFSAVTQALRDGDRTSEREIDAEIQRVYRARGASDAFGSIVACGRNACVLHYRDNDGPLESGQMLLVDSGARIDGYCADVTRTLPVSGTLDGRQREIYEIVLRAQAEAIDCCRPGKTLGDVHETAWRVIDAAGFGDAFVHGTSHHLGIEVHDVGDPHEPLEAGAVVTVEPGIYLPDEALGCRIEDDVLVTGSDPRVLTAAIPKDPT